MAYCKAKDAVPTTTISVPIKIYVANGLGLLPRQEIFLKRYGLTTVAIHHKCIRRRVYEQFQRKL